MTSLGLVLVVTAFLSGAACAVFVMIVIGIRQGDRPWHLHHAGHRQLAERPRRLR